MMMYEFEINNKFILRVLMPVICIIGIIFLLNKYDQNKKIKEASHIFEAIENSSFKQSVINAIMEFDSNKVEGGLKIREIFQHRKKEYRLFGNSILYIKRGDLIYELPYYGGKESIPYNTKKGVLIEDEVIINKLRNKNIDSFSLLKSINKDKERLKIYHLLEKNENNFSFMITTKSRNNNRGFSFFNPIYSIH